MASDPTTPTPISTSIDDGTERPTHSIVGISKHGKLVWDMEKEPGLSGKELHRRLILVQDEWEKTHPPAE